MTAILRLIHVTRRPGALEQHNLTGAMQGEPQASGSIGGQQQIVVTGLKAIHDPLTLHRFEATSEQLPSKPLLQQLQRLDETTE